MWRLVHQWSFFAVWLLLTVGTLLIHGWYSLGRPVMNGTPMVIFVVLTVFWLFLHQQCTNRHMSTKTVPTVYQSSKTVKTAKMTIGLPIVTCLPRLHQPCTNSVPIVKNSQKTVKTAKMTNGVPVVTCLPRVYQPCTNRQKQSNSKKWPLVYQSSHVYTESAEYTKSVSAEYTKPKTVPAHP